MWFLNVNKHGNVGGAIPKYIDIYHEIVDFYSNFYIGW